MLDEVRFAHPPDSLTRKYRTSFEDGARTQFIFIDSATACGYTVLPSLMKDDQRKHIDAWIRCETQTYSVDIKSRKRLSRSSGKQDALVCLELHGVHPNNAGWMYGGSADLIAFETFDTFLLVWRERLVNIADFVIGADRVARSQDAVYKRYGRRGCEQITWVETNMLRNPWVLFTEIEKVKEQVNLCSVENGGVLAYVRR